MELVLKIHETRLFVSVDSFLEDPEAAVHRLRLIQRNWRVRDNDETKRKIWTEEQLRIFAIEVTAIGICNVKPKMLQKTFDRFQVRNQQIGSHLQKYKLKLVQQYGLQSLNELENWMYPKEFQYDTEIRKLASKWQSNQLDIQADFDCVYPVYEPFDIDE